MILDVLILSSIFSLLLLIIYNVYRVYKFRKVVTISRKNIKCHDCMLALYMAQVNIEIDHGRKIPKHEKIAVLIGGMNGCEKDDKTICIKKLQELNDGE